MEATPEIRFTFSAEIDKLAPALVKFQKAVKPVLKGSRAKVEKEGRLLYSYAYANFADVQEATREPLADADLAVIQPPVGSSADGITIVTIVLHSSGQWMRGDLTAKPLDQKPQTIGSLITYNRRYSYSGCLGIVTEEDDDGAAAQGKGIAGGAAKANTVKATPTALMANASQIQQIHIAKEKIGGWTGKADHPGHPYRLALSAYKDAKGEKVQSSKDLTYEQASNLIKRMQGMIDRQADNAKRMEDQAPIAGAMNGNNEREPGADDDDTGEACDAGQLQNVREAAKSRWGKKAPDLAPQWLQKEFGVSETAALTKMQAERALQLLLSGDVLQ